MGGETTYFAIFVPLMVLGLIANIFGLPGTVLVFVLTLGYFALSGFEEVGILPLAIMFLLTLAAEIGDFWLGIKGAFRLRFHPRSLGAAILGGMTGALVFTPLFLGLGLMAGIFFGGLAGVLLYELHDMYKMRPSLRNIRGIILGGVSAGTRGLGSLAVIFIFLVHVYG